MKVTKKKCDFIVLKERRQVICILKGTRYAFTNYVQEFSDWDPPFRACKDEDKLYLPDYFVGIATCAAEDKWDEQLGKDIAYSKALNKFNRSFFKRAQRYVSTLESYLNKVFDGFNAYGAKLEKCEVDRAKWIESRIESNT